MEYTEYVIKVRVAVLTRSGTSLHLNLIPFVRLEVQERNSYNSPTHRSFA